MIWIDQPTRRAEFLKIWIFDMESSKELKREAVGRLRLMLPLWEERLREIDGRLVTYFEGLCRESGYEEGEKDLHNVYEVLAGLRFLRQMDVYVFRVKRVRHVIETYEGVWKDGRHVSGGFKLSGMRGMTHYQLTPVQVFMLAAVFGPHYWYATGDKEEDRRRGDGTLDLMPTERVMDGEVYDLRMLCIEAVYFIPRKFCKTTMAAFFQAYFFLYGDHNAEGYCVANSLDQAKILFKMVKSLLEQLNPGGKRIRITQTEANWKRGQASDAKIAVLSAGGKTKDGLFAQICSADEFGASQYVNGKSEMAQLVNVVEGSMGPRRERLTVHTSTAGIGIETPYEVKIRALRKILEQEVAYLSGEVPRPAAGQPLADERTFPFLLQLDAWEMEKEYVFTHPECWQKVNPHIGITVQRDYYETEISKAKTDGPDKEVEVLSKLFNLFQTGKVTEWVKPEEVRKLQASHALGVVRRIEDCLYDDGWDVYCGMDFSQGNDLHACTYLAKRWKDDGGCEFFAGMDAWINEETLSNSSISDLYRLWIKEGWLRLSPGKVFQPNLLSRRIRELDELGVNFVGFGYDAHLSKEVVNELKAWLQTIGVRKPDDVVIPISQTYGSFNPAVDRLTYLIKGDAGMLTFDDNPLWPYEFGCAVLDVDVRMENKKPRKRSDSDACKVDNVQCLCEALLLEEIFEGRIDK